jgi:hypothetical protein
MDQMASISLAFNVALALLLTISEALPFIKSRDYNGLLDFIAHKLSNGSKPIQEHSERSGQGAS